MSHYFSTLLVQISSRGHRLVVVRLLSLMILLSGGGTLWVGSLWAGSLTANQQASNYAWTVKSGLSTVVIEEGLRVVLTEATQSATGVVAAIRFFDESSEMLSEVTGAVLPGSPLVATFLNQGQGGVNRMLVRFEIELFSTDVGVVPVTTVEREGTDGQVVNNYMCAGPPADGKGVYSCGNQDPECGNPSIIYLPCGALVGFRSTS